MATTTQTTQTLQPNYTPEQLATRDLYSEFGRLGLSDQELMDDIISNYLTGKPLPTTAPNMLSQDAMKQYDDPWMRSVAKVGELSKTKQNRLYELLWAAEAGYKTHKVPGWVDANIWPAMEKEFGFTPEESHQLLEDIYRTSKFPNDALNEFKAGIAQYKWLPAEQQSHIQEYIEMGPESYKEKYTIQYPDEMPTTQEIVQEFAEQHPESPIAEIMAEWTPENLLKQIDIAETQQRRGLEDWKTQAMREMEQRGITQSSGLMGSRTERDVGSIMGQYGHLGTELGERMNLARLTAERQNPTDVISALMPLMQYGTSTDLAKQGQALQSLIGYSTMPYGQQTTVTGQDQSAGLLPMLSDLTMMGLGTYGAGKGLGFWGNAGTGGATAFGMNLAGSAGGAATGNPVFSLAGAQNLWNKYY